MTEAVLSARFDASQVERGITNLDRLAIAAEKAEAATTSLGKASSTLSTGVSGVERATSQIVSILDRMEKSLGDISRSTASMATDLGRATTSIDNTANAAGRGTTSMNNYAASVNKVTTAIIQMGKAANSNVPRPAPASSPPPPPPPPPPSPPAGGGGSGGTGSPWGSWNYNRSASGVPMMAVNPQSLAALQQKGSAANAYQMQNLGYQIGDIVASGSTSSMSQIAMQQGPQIAQLFTGPNALKFSDLASGAANLAAKIGPVVGGFGAVAAALGVALAAQNSYSKSQIEAARQLEFGLGRGSGVSVSEANRIASGAYNSSGRISTGAALSATSAIAGTGKVNASMTSELVNSLPDFMAMTGQKADEASKQLATMFSTGVSGAQEAQKVLGTFTDAQMDNIKSSAAQGKQLEINNAIMQKYRDNIASATNLTTGWTRVSQRISASAGSLWNDVGRGVDNLMGGGDLETQISKAREKVSSAEFTRDFGYGGLFKGSQGDVDKAAANLQKLLDLQVKLRKESEDEQNAVKGQKVADTIREIVPDIGKLEGFTNATKLLSENQGELAAKLGLSKDALGNLGVALVRVNAAKAEFKDRDALILQGQNLAIESIRAYSLEERLASSYSQKRAEVAQNAAIADTAEAQGIAAKTKTLEEYKRAAQDALRTSEDSLKSAGMLPYARAMTDLQTQYKRTVDQFGQGDIRSRELANNMKSTSINMLGAPLQNSGFALREQASNLRVQADSFYATAEQAGYLAEKQRLINEYMRLGGNDINKMLPQIESLAQGYGKVAGEAEKFQRTSQNITQGMDEIRSSTKGIFTGIFSDLRQGRDLKTTISNSLGGLADKIFDRGVSKPLTESLLGFDGKGGGGLFGDMISKTGLFGSIDGKSIAGLAGMAQTTAMMTVNAASVVVNGGVGAGVGGIPGMGSSALSGTGASGTSIGGATIAATSSASSGGDSSGSLGGFGILGGAVTAAKALFGGSGGSKGALPITVSPSGVVTNSEKILSDVALPYKSAASISGTGVVGGGTTGSGITDPFNNNGWNFPFEISKKNAMDAIFSRQSRLTAERELGSRDPNRIYDDPVSPHVDTSLDRFLPSSSATKIGVRLMDDTANKATSAVDQLSQSATDAATQVSSMGNQALDAGAKLLQSMSSAVAGPGGGGIGALVNMMGATGTNANGTEDWRGGSSWVGESGPEIVSLPRGARVTPNHRLPTPGNTNNVYAPMSIEMQGSSGDKVADMEHVNAVSAEMDRRFQQNLQSAMRQGGPLWDAGVRRTA